MKNNKENLPHLRELIVAPTNVGKTYRCVNELKKYETLGYKSIMCTLDNNKVFKADLQALYEAGFIDVISKRAPYSNFWYKEKWQVYLGTTNVAYGKDFCAALTHSSKKVLFLDEFDKITFKVKNYEGSKGKIFGAYLDSLTYQDAVMTASASITQALAMDYTWNKLTVLNPYKDGYRGLLRRFSNNLHKIKTLSDADLASLDVGNELTIPIKNLIKSAKKDYKLGINVTNYVSHRESGAYLADIARKVKKLGKKVYIIQGGNDNLPKNDPEYYEADVIILGGPAGRAMVIPDLFNTIWRVPTLLDRIIQEQRQNIYFDPNDERESAYWVTETGKKRLEEALKVQDFLYETADHWMGLELTDREKWAESQLDWPAHIKLDLFSKGKEGNYEQGEKALEPNMKLEYNEANLRLAEENGYKFIDTVGQTKDTKEGNYKFGEGYEHKIATINGTANRWNKSKTELTRDKHSTRKLIIEDTTDKRVGLPYVLISGTQEKRWSQLHIENNNMHIYCYEHKERVNTIRRKNEF